MDKCRTGRNGAVELQIEMMLNVEFLKHVELLTPKSQPVFFEELWQQSPVVLSLVRHFGCIFCFELSSDLLDLRDKIQEHGAELALVGNGNPIHAMEFMSQLGLTRGVYTDPGRVLYKGLQMAQGVRSSINLSSTIHVKRAIERGFRQRRIQGDPWQQGGVMLIRKNGEVPWLYRSKVAGDHPSTDEIVRALSTHL